MKFTLNEIPSYKEKYCNNYSLAALNFSEYENVAGFIFDELTSANDITVQFCTDIDPATFSINGRSITVTHEEDAARIWYDGLESEFTIYDFTNADAGFCFYKITNNTSGDIYYSDLMCISKMLPVGINSLRFYLRVLLENNGFGESIWIRIIGESVQVNGDIFITDSLGAVLISGPSSTIDYRIPAGNKTISHLTDYDAAWDEITGTIDLTAEPPSISLDDSGRSSISGTEDIIVTIQVDEFERLA